LTGAATVGAAHAGGDDGFGIVCPDDPPDPHPYRCDYNSQGGSLKGVRRGGLGMVCGRWLDYPP
jgi:hypothetical protein